MFGIAGSFMLIQYVWYSRQFNGGTICAVQQTVQYSHNMCSTADSLMLTQYVQDSRQFNAHKICVVQQTI
jgi:hypothetical protein